VTAREKLESLGIPKHAVAALADSTPAKMSLWLRDAKLVRRDEAEAFDRALAYAVKLAEATRGTFPRGVCLDWKDTIGVRELFNKLFVQGAENVVPTA
jgi:hypothetical protein